MTQEEKQLLLNVICTMLPHKVYAHYYDVEDERYEDAIIDGVDITNSTPEILIAQYGLFIEGIKPYLRPMSSMTEEERKDFYGNLRPKYDGKPWESMGADVDWLNAHHFDYRELIEKGLALEAKDGMYNI